ncbi:Protein of unknown function [Pyronema omphalodes CBS 100304]|uniref:Uncharacterized protein n=1 Tax=Pyronema omphalodes (strain CBS 100304) TaxID=1076935 RepID=U4LR38_PYROM|nr:Protein of unknown function [Pyronema omphalodes CBS 100304]
MKVEKKGMDAMRKVALVKSVKNAKEAVGNIEWSRQVETAKNLRKIEKPVEAAQVTNGVKSTKPEKNVGEILKDTSGTEVVKWMGKLYENCGTPKAPQKQIKNNVFDVFSPDRDDIFLSSSRDGVLGQGIFLGTYEEARERALGSIKGKNEDMGVGMVNDESKALVLVPKGKEVIFVPSESTSPTPSGPKPSQRKRKLVKRLPPRKARKDVVYIDVDELAEESAEAFTQDRTHKDETEDYDDYSEDDDLYTLP